MPEAKQYRDCQNTNNCNLIYNKPAEEQDCIYVPSCEDNIQNQGELDIDCGGPCPSCAPIIDERPETIMSPIAEFLFLAGIGSLGTAIAIIVALISVTIAIVTIVLKRKKIKKWLKKKKLW